MKAQSSVYGGTKPPKAKTPSTPARPSAIDVGAGRKAGTSPSAPKANAATRSPFSTAGNRTPEPGAKKPPGRASTNRSPVPAGRPPLASSTRSPLRGAAAANAASGVGKLASGSPKVKSPGGKDASSPVAKKVGSPVVNSPLRYREGKLTPRSAIRFEKDEKKRIKQAEEASRRRLEEQRLLEEEKTRKEEEKKRKIQEALKAKLDARKAAESALLQARTALREKENARKRLHHQEREMESSWPYKMRLHYAALEGDMELAGSLLAQDTEESFNSNKIDPNFQWREDGQAPLHLAVVKGQVPMVKLLIACNANPDLRDNDGRTALIVAAEHGEELAVRALVEAGAEINAPDQRGRTPLHVAAQMAQRGTVRLLLRLRASPLARTHTQGWTPLHVAAASKYQDMEVVWLLLGGHRLRLSEAEAERARAEASARESDSDGDMAEEDAEEDADAAARKEEQEQEQEETVPQLERGEAWERHVERFVSETTREGLAMERVQRKYPREWLYHDDAQLLELCMQRCPGLPLPPYVSALNLQSNMSYTPLDEAPPGSELRRALEAAVLLDNELVERRAEDQEKETGVIRVSSVPDAPRQLARLRTRKLALVFGNPTGPGSVVTAVCRDDASQTAKHLADLGFQVTVKIDADRLEMLQAIDEMRARIREGDCVVVYFSGHARRVDGVDYLVPARCKPDELDQADKYERNAVPLRLDLIGRLQVQPGTLTLFLLDVFRGSPSILAPAGCGRWRTGRGDWQKRVPAAFLPHIRPPGTAASVVRLPPEGAPPWEGPRMEGSMDGIEENRWALLAGEAIGAVEGIEELLEEDGSACVVYSHEPGGTLFPNEPALLSPFTHVLLKHLHNPGGGARGSGGGYPMMLADIKSEVMAKTKGRQCPWSYMTADADGLFSFCPAAPPVGHGRFGHRAAAPEEENQPRPDRSLVHSQSGMIRTSST